MQIILDLQRLYGIRAKRVLHDAHPNLPATRWALGSGLPTTAVWHHYAHASAVSGEFAREAPLLCFTWDGLGLGPDHTLWGGEALLGSPGNWHRVASFRPFKLPGGARAAHEPWRTALSLCWQIGVNWSACVEGDNQLLRQAYDHDVNSPVTTSVGRLFDAAAALSGVCIASGFEGEAPMRLEALCNTQEEPIRLPLLQDETGIWRSDWSPLIELMLRTDLTTNVRAARFHSSMAHALLAQACVVREQTGINHVGLSGGVFQNRVLTEQAMHLLEASGFEVLVPTRLPVNDAAISFGQLIEGVMLNARAR